MFSIKVALYLISLLFCMAGSVAYHPLIGVIGYLLSYNINPADQWWGSSLAAWGIRYSLFLAVATGIGMVVHRSKLNFNRLLESQETLLIIFLGIIWLSILLGFGFNPEDSNAIKMTKVAIILLIATHIVTDLKQYEVVIWTLILSGMYLAYETYNAPDWMFTEGRFDTGVGGSDFAEGNFLAAHFGMLLPFIGIMFFNSAWKGKAICLVSGILAVNAVVLTRSRGVFLGCIAGALAAVIFSVAGKRRQIILGIMVGLIGVSVLTDPGFWVRMSTISVESSQMGDSSVQGRILAWEAALSMAADHPMGIGEGNFKKYVGQYNPDIPGKDTHNTFLRCLAELGIQGFVVLVLLTVNAFRILRRVRNQVRGWANEADFQWHIFGLKVSLVIFLSASMFVTETYIEEFYWLLFFPVMLQRAADNQMDTEVSV